MLIHQHPNVMLDDNRYQYQKSIISITSGVDVNKCLLYDSEGEIESLLLMRRFTSKAEKRVE